MPPTILKDYHVQLIDTIREYSSSFKWWSAPLNLGGSSGASGGSGVPLGGMYGQLIQSKVAYDTSELAYSGLPNPSEASILDNLAHIRNDLAIISGGTLSEIQEGGVEIVTEATILDFDAEFDITDEGGGKAGIGYGTLQRITEDRTNFHESGAQTQWREGVTSDSLGILIGYSTDFVGGAGGFKVDLKGDDFGNRGFLAVGSIEASTFWRDRFIDVDGNLYPVGSTERLFGIISTPSIIPAGDGRTMLAAFYGRADVGKHYDNPASGIAFLAETPRAYKAKYGHFNKIYGLYVTDQDVGLDENYAIYTNLGLVSLGDTLDMRGNDIINIGDESLKFESGVTITSSGILDLTDGGETSLHIHDARYYTETEVDALVGQEVTEDFVGAMVSGNTETLISVTYDDGAGKLNFVVDEASIDHGNLTGLDTGADHSYIDQSVVIAATPTFAGVTLNNAGLHILDTNASHDLIISPGSDLTADRILSLVTGDAARTITLSGDPTLADWFDQDVKVAASPTFAGLTLEGNQIIDVTSTEALLVRKNADGGDIFIVDTTNSEIEMGGNLIFNQASTISTTAGDLTLDATDDIQLTAGGGDVFVNTSGIVADLYCFSDLDVGQIGRVLFRGHNSTPADFTYAYISGNVVNFGAGAEDGSVSIYTRVDGVFISIALFNGANAGLLVHQSFATGAKPVLFLDQGDVSEQIIKASYSGADVDMTIIELDVTGAPKFGWSETPDTFYLNKGIAIGDGGTTNYSLFSGIGDLSFVGTAGFYPRRINQAGVPAAGVGATQIDTGELLVWRDSDDGKIYVVYNDTTTGIKHVELAL